MSLVKVHITYRLKLITPVHVGTGTGGSGFLDKYVYRQGGCPVIPGSTVKGRLRAAVTASHGPGYTAQLEFAGKPVSAPV